MSLMPPTRSYGKTHPGKVRDHNEDSFLDLATEGLWVVADGAGGHEKGEVASQLIVETLSKFKRLNSLGADVCLILDMLKSVNKQLVDMRENLPGKGLIGSTVSLLILHETHCVCIWSGDSRIYLSRQNQLFRLTRDHNRIDEFLHGGFSEKELEGYSVAHQLTQAVGASEYLGYDIQLYEHLENDLFLLCSDGLTGELSETAILNLLESVETPVLMGEKLINRVLNTTPARDNTTVLLVSIQKEVEKTS